VTEPAATEPRRRRARGSLSPDQILEAAQELVERDGLRALSMPILAEHLKSGVTSLYWYFRSKDALVEALAERVMADVHQRLPPVGDGPWDEELIAYFDAFHDVLRAWPAYREVVAYGSGFIAPAAMTRTAQRRLGEGLALLRRAGLDEAAATEVFGACLSWTRGFVVLQQGSQDRTEPAEHSELAALNRIDDDRFRLGLRLLVAGIRVELEAGTLPALATGEGQAPATKG
jgi:AcrR family transcriptional regulator